MSEKIQHGYKMVTIGKKITFHRAKAKAISLLKLLVPEVGVPSFLQGKLTDTGWKPRGILSPILVFSPTP
jgi:hypothetical protein